MNINRRFNWISSKTGNKSIIDGVNQKLAEFYSLQKNRENYQKMLDAIDVMPNKGDINSLLLEYIMRTNPAQILEVGCGSGRIYKQLINLNYSGVYKGIEVADYIIQNNRKVHPEVEWLTAGAYHIPYENESFEMCFAFFVLEHLVYPESGIREMLRVLKKKGKLVLVFPDFIESRRLASQELGLSPIENARQKFRQGRIMDTLISLYDSRIRLRRALKRIHQDIGRFPINTNLICLNHKDIMGADVDAVYIASKKEIDEWALENNLKIEFPFGTEGDLKEKAFLVIERD